MTKSAKGTVSKPGRNVRQKSGLNRAILNQGWGEFLFCLEYKLALKGGILERVSPQYTSQTCPKCGHTEKANRNKKIHLFCYLIQLSFLDTLVLLLYFLLNL